MTLLRLSDVERVVRENVSNPYVRDVVIDECRSLAATGETQTAEAPKSGPQGGALEWCITHPMPWFRVDPNDCDLIVDGGVDTAWLTAAARSEIAALREKAAERNRAMKLLRVALDHMNCDAFDGWNPRDDVRVFLVDHGEYDSLTPPAAQKEMETDGPTVL